ncbi:hypothetical protein CDIK_1103 [Cucumispora dikerogammari]|nr:hypothetical protein CDIK_1103 [Cucumispora dikerogammari]
MFSLIYNILSVSTHTVGLSNEKFNLKIINCVDRNGDLANSVLFGNETAYKLELSYNEKYWSMLIYCYIGPIPYNLGDFNYSYSEIVKCNENVGICGYDNGFVLNDHEANCNKIEKTETGIIHAFNISHSWIKSCFSLKHIVLYDSPGIKESCEECNKTTITNYFKKKLGILKDKNKASVFKIRIICEVACWAGEKYEIITFETEQFMFGEDEKDNLILKKVKKIKTCRKSAVEDK